MAGGYTIEEVLDMRDCLIENIKGQTDKNNYGAGLMADNLLRSGLIDEDTLWRQSDAARKAAE